MKVEMRFNGKPTIVLLPENKRDEMLLSCALENAYVLTYIRMKDGGVNFTVEPSEKSAEAATDLDPRSPTQPLRDLDHERHAKYLGSGLLADQSHANHSQDEKVRSLLRELKALGVDQDLPLQSLL